MGCSPHTKNTPLSLRRARVSGDDEIKGSKCRLATNCKQSQRQPTPAVRQALSDVGYDGWASIEDGGLQLAEFSRRFDLIIEGK